MILNEEIIKLGEITYTYRNNTLTVSQPTSTKISHEQSINRVKR